MLCLLPNGGKGDRMTIRSIRDLGAAVRGRRKDLGWTQTQLAERAGVSRKWIYRVRGRESRRPSSAWYCESWTRWGLTSSLMPRSRQASRAGAPPVDLDALLDEHRASMTDTLVVILDGRDRRDSDPPYGRRASGSNTTASTESSRTATAPVGVHADSGAVPSRRRDRTVALGPAARRARRCCRRWARDFHVSAASPFSLLATPIGARLRGRGALRQSERRSAT